MTLKTKLIVGLLAWVAISVTVWVLLRPNPERILAEAWRNIFASGGVEYEMNFDIKESATRLQGQVQSAVGLARYPYASASTWTFTASSSAEIRTVIGESRRIADVRYFRLDSSADKWFRTRRPVFDWVVSDMTGLPAVASAMAGPGAVSTPENVSFQRRLESSTLTPFEISVWNWIPDIPSGFRDDKKAADQFRQALPAASLLHFVSRLADVGTGRDRLYRFRVRLDPAAVFGLILKLRELRGEELTADDRAAAAAEAASWGEPTGEIWISKADGRPRKLTFIANVAGPRGRAEASLEMNFISYGTQPAVSVPVDFEDLDQSAPGVATDRLQPAAGRAVQSATSGSNAGAAAPAASEPDFDDDGLSDSQEQFYGSDPRNPDTDGDGRTDGQEVASGTNPTGSGALFGFGLGR